MDHDKLEINVFDGSLPAAKVIALRGVLNAETAFPFRDLVRSHDRGDLVIDMSRLRSMDSSGLGVLIGLYVSCERACRRLLLAGLNDRIWELFHMCKIEDVFTRYPTVSDAQHALTLPAESVATS